MYKFADNKVDKCTK